jgi:hypothetical protein
VRDQRAGGRCGYGRGNQRENRQQENSRSRLGQGQVIESECKPVEQDGHDYDRSERSRESGKPSLVGLFKKRAIQRGYDQLGDAEDSSIRQKVRPEGVDGFVPS